MTSTPNSDAGAGPTPPPASASELPPIAPNTPFIVCLGASAGGLEALEAFFAALPPATGATFIIVVHLSPDFKSLMPELIARHTPMRVVSVTGPTVPQANTIYIISPGKNMVMTNGELQLEAQDRTGSHILQLPIDIFLQSLAMRPAHRVAAVILSGTGSDGSRGVRLLKDAGGTVLAQHPENARFDGMPKSALETGCVDATDAPGVLATMVADLIEHGRLPGAEDEEGREGDGDIVPLLEAIRTHLNMDLGYLRPSMLLRRARRRMALHGMGALGDYVERISADVAETRALCQDTLIGVTSFFRDAESFKKLQKHLANDLLRRQPEEQFRVWVPACSSGEEVYSLAMIILEALEANGLKRDVKIFATDMDEDSLARGSRATYPAACISDIGPARVSRFFTCTNETVTAKPVLREMVIFAHHNLVRDPPFTRIDLVSCRNFLIYIRPAAQEVVLGSLHFALRRNGTLFLGSAEALGKLEGEFEPIDGRHKIFRKTRNVVLPTMRLRSGMRDPGASAGKPAVASKERERENANRQILEMLLEREGRTAAMITMDGALSDILADPLGVFQMPRGRPTSDVVRLLTDSLTVAVATGIQRLRRGEPEVQYAVDASQGQGQHLTARLTRLAPTAGLAERILLLVEPTRSNEPDRPLDLSTMDKDASSRMKELQNELMQTRESLQATIEELQSANEEQQSTNEELVASNEELQSTNEELQSVNEELFTVNVEYQNKIQELAVVAADLNNLLRNINIGILFLDPELRIRKFTPAIENIVKLVEHDIGRSIESFSHSIGPEFVRDAKRVVETGETVERDARSARGNWLLVRMLPYVTQTNSISGVVATFFDITPIRNAHEMTRVVNEQLAHANRGLSDQRAELEEMFSIVAHDLKRPVLALDGLLSLIRGDAGDRPPEAEAELLPRAVAECGRMRRMLLDLESISGIQHRDIVVDPVPLQAWVDELVDRYRPEAAKRSARINCTCDGAEVRIARTFLEEVFSNLMENALKYGCGSPSPRIDVAVRVVADSLELSVADNGAGIPHESHQKIFEPFRRLHPELATGSGIGLMAVRRLVTRLGGTISLESALGRGAKFLVRIPLLHESAEAAGEARSKPRVLIVEDDLLDAKMIERCIRDTHTVTRTQDMADAEERLAREPVDLVLLDLSLPDGHGFELVNRIRTKLKLSTPVVVITGHGEGIAPNVMSAMIGGYVSKAELTKETLMRAVFQAMTGAHTSPTPAHT